MSGRLHVRMTARCNSGCDHCTIADIAHLPERSFEAAWGDIESARREGCDALVIMRGEATLRLKDLVRLTRRAKAIGYAWVQLQTNGRRLAYIKVRDALRNAGVDFYEVALFGSHAAVHDAIDKNAGAFEQVSSALQSLVSEGQGVLVTVPVTALNLDDLSATVRRLAAWGVGRVQFGFLRPVQVAGVWQRGPLVPLSAATPKIRAALRLAKQLGLSGETEGVPLCHLDPDPELWGGDIRTDLATHRVADSHRAVASRAETRDMLRPLGPGCMDCVAQEICPRTWAAYQELFGTDELGPLSDAGAAAVRVLRAANDKERDPS